MKRRSAQIIPEVPQLCAEPDGRLWHVVYDHGPACDRRFTKEEQYMCRLPAGHSGEHLYFKIEHVNELGVRLHD